MKTIRLFLFTCSLLWGSLAVCLADGYTIYPVPHQQVKVSGEASFTPTVTVVAEAGIDDVTRQRVADLLAQHQLTAVFATSAKGGQSVIYLGLNGSRGVADRMVSRLRLSRQVFGMQKYDRHLLHLYQQKGRAQVVILGEHTDAVFCALASLEQMLDRGVRRLPCVTLYDYADVANRGVIEGYYGVPYTMEVTADLFRFMARYKLNCYMYGAKSDPYHSRYWDRPYPQKISKEQQRIGMMTQDMMRHLADVARQTKVNFIWAIHPGQQFTDDGDDTVLDRIMQKFQNMYELGFRQFGVFVDDVGVPSDQPTLERGARRLTALQRLVEERWNRDKSQPLDTVKPLQYVPQLYAFSWVTADKAQRFWQSLTPVPSHVNIYTTGKNVWSVPNSADLDVLHSYLGREVSWWWNYPCNDNDVTKIFPADTYSNFADETHIANGDRLEDGLRLQTIIINPMQQGELSKIALFSVADYSWNMHAFDNMQSWKASLPAVVGDRYAAALERLAPHLRYYDRQSVLTPLVEAYQRAHETRSADEAAAAERLLGALQAISADCRLLGEMEGSGQEPLELFYQDLRPWLLKLCCMADNAQVMVKALSLPEGSRLSRVDFARSWSAIDNMEKADNHRFEILTGMGNDITLSQRTAEPSAEVLRPFLSWLLQQLAAE